MYLDKCREQFNDNSGGSRALIGGVANMTRWVSKLGKGGSQTPYFVKYPNVKKCSGVCARIIVFQIRLIFLELHHVFILQEEQRSASVISIRIHLLLRLLYILVSMAPLMYNVTYYQNVTVLYGLASVYEYQGNKGGKLL